MVAIPLYCKSLEFQFETKLCIFQNISKYFIEKIPHVLPNVQRDENQADITKMLNIGGDPAEWDFGYVPPPPDTAPTASFPKPASVGRGAMRRKQSDFRNTTVGGRKKCSPSGLRGSKSRRHRNEKVFGAQPAGNATMRMPLRASARRGCGPHDSASRPFPFIILIRYLLFGQKVTYEEIRHATERERGLASQTGGCRKRFHSFFVLTNKKCGMTRGGVFGLLFAGGQSCSDKIYLRRLRGSRFARAAEDNAAPRRSRSGLRRCCGCGPNNQKKYAAAAATA